MAKLENGPHIAFQLLIYPITILRPDSPSSFSFSPSLIRAPAVNWFYSHYVPHETEDHSNDPRLSPLMSEDFSGLPPAYIVTAGFDPLHDEGVAYADKLKSAGVKVRHVDYPTMIHGFFSFAPLLDEGKAAQRLACDRLRLAFAGAAEAQVAE